MKKFYLHDGITPSGPYNLEDLKYKHLIRETPVWYEGLDEWIMAGQIPELRELLSPISPPAFVPNTRNSPPAKKEFGMVSAIVSVVAILVTFVVTIMVINNFTSGVVTTEVKVPQTYRQSIMTIEETERAQPARFLKVEGKHSRNFWGNKIIVNGNIQNKATVVGYKDVVLKVIFYDKNSALLGNEVYTLNDSFPPHTMVKFDVKIEQRLPVDSIKCSVISAKTY